MKTVAVVISGAAAGDNIRDIDLEPGTTALEILNSLNLHGYLLSRANSAQYFANEENVYVAVQSGEKLAAVPQAEVGFTEQELLLRALGVVGIALVSFLICGLFSALLKIDFNRHSKNWQQPKANARAKVRSRSGGNGARSVVARNTQPLWKARGWHKQGKKLTGAFRTPHGSVTGEISTTGHYPEYFIINPPRALLTGGHASCFRKRGGGKYAIHFGHKHKDVDAGIVAIEKLITRQR